MKPAFMHPLTFPTFTLERRSKAELVANSLRSGCLVSDETFDQIYPSAVRHASAIHWTPLRVCARIVALLDLKPGQRLLDVGAGAGKFCIVAAAMSQAVVRGIEREPYLAEVAREAARRFAIDIEVVDDTFDAEHAADVDVDAVYLFNPFIEALFLPGVGELASADRQRTAVDIAAAETFLAAARAGTRLVTFCGFGGKVPSSYDRRVSEAWDGGVLELWEKRSAHAEPLSARGDRSLPSRPFAERACLGVEGTTTPSETSR